MKVEVKLFAFLSYYMPNPLKRNDNMVEIEEGTTIKKLLLQLNVPLEKVKLIFLNGVHATGDEILKENDRVGVFPAIAGG